jgi:hypothetical protein
VNSPTPTDPPAIAYWHVWTDADGVSRQSRGTIERFSMQSISSGASAQWIGEKANGSATVLFTVLPPGWQGDWHENPAPQWIIPLQGRWAVQTMDGAQVEMGPGDVSFGADQGTRPVDGKQGHRSWTVGDEAAVLMLVQLGAGMERPPIPPSI